MVNFMKKQIISLIVCLATFTTTPGFCMELEDKPKGHFSKVLIESQINGLNKQKEENFDSSSQTPSGTLSFIYEMAYPEHSEKLAPWLISKIDSNREAKNLLNLSLKNGDLKVLLMQERHNHGGYSHDDRRIELQIAFLTLRFNDAMSISHDLLDGDFGCNHILRTFIFELGNSVNESLHKIWWTDYPNAETYARAVEVAEFETQAITIPVFEHGVNFCNWHPGAFVHSDLDVLKKIAYEDIDEHYQFYVNQYNQDYIYNTVGYYLGKIKSIFSRRS